MGRRQKFWRAKGAAFQARGLRLTQAEAQNKNETVSFFEMSV
jgi:hypothetical protein